MTNASYLISNFIGGMVSGAIGAYASEDSDHPVLRGAIVTGLVSGAVGAVLIALSPAPKQLPSGALSDEARFP